MQLPPVLLVLAAALLTACASDPPDTPAEDATSDATTQGQPAPSDGDGSDAATEPAPGTTDGTSGTTMSTAGDADTSGSTGTDDTGGEVSATPIWIAAANYVQLQDELADLGPFVVYGWASDPAFAGYDQQLDLLGQIDADDVTKIVMLSSWTTLESVLTPDGVAALQAAGVEGFGYNTEGMMTPPAQMQALDDPTDANPVAIFATLAAAEGFWTVWGPIRFTADAVSDAAISAMIAGGVRGVALQEQQFIESACVPERVAAVEATAERYRALAADPDFEVHVQVMPSRCSNGDDFAVAQCGMSPNHAPFAHCEASSADIAPTIDAMAIWASAPFDVDDLAPLTATLRGALGG